MIETLSAAEIKTLQSPENEQVKVVLPLLLKELVLRGWLNAFQGKRPMHSGWWLFLGVTILSLFIHFFVTIVLAIIFLANVVESRSKKTMFALTQRGEAQLQNLGPDAPLLVRVLKTVADARPAACELIHQTIGSWSQWNFRAKISHSFSEQRRSFFQVINPRRNLHLLPQDPLLKFPRLFLQEVVHVAAMLIGNGAQVSM